MTIPTKLDRFRDLSAALRIQRAAAANERLPREQLVARRDAALGELVAHATTHSRFYREHVGDRVAAHEVRLADLPIVTKTHLMERFDELVTDPGTALAELERHVEQLDADELYLGRYRVMTSSGSSGRRAVYVYDRDEWRQVIASALRWTAWTDLRPRLPRPRVASIGATGPRHMTWRGASSMDAGVHRSLRLRVDQPLDELIDELNAFRPYFLIFLPVDRRRSSPPRSSKGACASARRACRRRVSSEPTRRRS